MKFSHNLRTPRSRFKKMFNWYRPIFQYDADISADIIAFTIWPHCFLERLACTPAWGFPGRRSARPTQGEWVTLSHVVSLRHCCRQWIYGRKLQTNSEQSSDWGGSICTRRESIINNQLDNSNKVNKECYDGYFLVHNFSKCIIIVLIIKTKI